MTVLLLLSITLTLNAISASAVNGTSADDLAQDKKVKTTTTTTNNNANLNTSSEKTTTTKNITTTNSPRYEGVPDTGKTTTSVKYAAGSAAATKLIKVLIYTGKGASLGGVNGIKASLNTANSKNLVSGVRFSYATSSKLTSAKLKGYNLLILPGGDGGSVYLGSISKSVIQNFVKNGGGYMGICAGAYSAVSRVDGHYNGWGIAPHFNAKSVSYIGKTKMAITSSGASVMKRNGTVTLSHYNGGAMYRKSSGGLIFGTYADSKTKYKGYADIVGDYYGKGRTVLIGSHPEGSPRFPDIIASLAAWASTTSTKITTTASAVKTSTSTSKASRSQVLTAASSVKSFYEKNKRLPNYVTINGNKVNMPKFLDLLTKATNMIKSGNTASISIKSVSSPTKPGGSIKSGKITRTSIYSIAQKVQTHINKYGRAPSSISTSLGKMSYSKLIYMFSKVLNFYKVNKRMPTYVAMAK